MDKGQHLRLVIVGGTTQTPTNKVIALATDMSLHLTAQTEDSTTKDSTDAATGENWSEFEITGRTGDIQFSALVGVGTDASGTSFADVLSSMGDTALNWKIVMASGTNNRTLGKTVCSGSGKISNLQADAPNRQNAQYSGTINIYGPVTVGSD